MTIPLFFPAVTYVPTLVLKSPVSVRELCARAGTRCRATGPWVEREVELVRGDEMRIFAEPGDWGRVRIELVVRRKREQAQLALAVLAYGLHDLVAKESIVGEPWARLRPPKGRPKSGRALTARERQRRFRERH